MEVSSNGIGPIAAIGQATGSSTYVSPDGKDIFGPTSTAGSTGQDSLGPGNLGPGEMHGGCYTDPATGQIICVDDFGNPSGSETDQGDQQTPSGMSGGCNQDPMTGEIICVDMDGKPEDLFAPECGCFTDESTGVVICID